MKSRMLPIRERQVRRYVLSILVSALPVVCNGQSADVALLLRQTPLGGKTIPAPGVYCFSPGSTLTLTAVAEPDFEFVYWLGEVSDPTSETTLVLLDKPKIVIAVFHPTRFEPSKVELPTIGGGFGVAPKRRRFAGEAVGYSTPHAGTELFAISVPHASYVRPAYEPQPIPEPATWVLIVLGATVILRRWRHALDAMGTSDSQVGLFRHTTLEASQA
jgi:hypothetical protein